MTNRRPRLTDEEWMSLIRECRSSGLSDKCWCEEHHIAISNFYYQIRKFRKLACEIPEPMHPSPAKKQEIVQLSFDNHSAGCLMQENPPDVGSSPETAIRITIPGYQIEITNAAASETVFHTLSALQKLC